MFKYHIRLSLVDKNASLNLLEHIDYIKETAKQYNIKKKNNPKEITDLQIASSTSIECNVTSRMELLAIGKAIKAYTAMLCQNDEFKNAVTIRGQLFSCELLSTTQYDLNKIDVSSDWKLIHALIDFVAKPIDKRTPSQQESFELIKKIAEDSNLI